MLFSFTKTEHKNNKNDKNFITLINKSGNPFRNMLKTWLSNLSMKCIQGEITDGHLCLLDLSKILDENGVCRITQKLIDHYLKERTLILGVDDSVYSQEIFVREFTKLQYLDHFFS